MFLKFVKKHFVDFNLSRTICTYDNKSKMTVANHLKNVNKSREYSTKGIARTFPKLEKPNLRTPNVPKDGDGMSFFLLCVPVAAFCLGTWQVKRKKWKENLIDELNYKTKAPAIDLPTEDEGFQDLEFKRVRVRGKFDHSGEMYLGPRPCLVEGESKYNSKLISAASNESYGYHVVTPFVLSDSNERILVNRGWVPFPQKNPKKRPEGQIQDEIVLEGIVRTTEPKPMYVPKDKPDVKIFLTRNVEKMADFAGTKPIYIDATSESTVPGGPIGGQTRVTLRNEHMSYILTWYSLSAATGIMYYMKYIKKSAII